MNDQISLVEHYNRWAHAMENVPDFYDWMIGELERAGVPHDARIVDIGCGTGALLRRLAERGYTNLSGNDFAPGCLTLALQQAPSAHLEQHDIQAAPLQAPFTVALMTTVIDFLGQPKAALANVHASLNEDGLLFLTIRNRQAYFPCYHLRSLERLLRFSPRMRHWFLWFTTPLAMRRQDQPLERIYAPEEMRRMLAQNRFEIITERGAQMFPMFWIADVKPAMWAMHHIDRIVQQLPATPLCFRYLFVCKKARPI